MPYTFTCSLSFVVVLTVTQYCSVTAVVDLARQGAGDVEAAAGVKGPRITRVS